MDRAPGYSISVESGRIVVTHLGELTLPLLEAWLGEVAKLANDGHLSFVLVDLSRAASSWLTTSEILTFCVSQQDAMPVGTTVAVVYRPDQASERDVLFAEAACRNRGLRLRSFTDLEAARRWLST